jgi:hypothetical protein
MKYFVNGYLLLSETLELLVFFEKKIKTEIEATYIFISLGSKIYMNMYLFQRPQR